MWYTKRDNEQKRVKDNGKSIMIKEQKKVLTMESIHRCFYLIRVSYISAILPKEKALYGGSRSRRRIKPAFSALAYYGEALREFFPQSSGGTPKTCDVGYESWVWCRYPLNIELL